MQISIGKVQFLILDEADRMLDMGFEPAIRQLVETLGLPANTDRQTLMFSATFKPDIQKLAGDFLNQYLFITVGIVGGACSDVEQTFLEVDRFEKRDRLCSILTSMGLLLLESDCQLVFVVMSVLALSAVDGNTGKACCQQVASLCVALL